MASLASTRHHVIIFSGLLVLAFIMPGRSDAADGSIAGSDILLRLESVIMAVDQAKKVSPTVMRTLTPLEQRGRENLQEAHDLLVAAKTCLKDGALPSENLAVTPRGHKWLKNHLVNDGSLGKSGTGTKILLILIDVSNIKRTGESTRGKRETMNLVKQANDLLLRALNAIDGSVGLSKE